MPDIGSRVIRHTSVEGTGCYIPTSPTDDDREWADRPGLVAVTPQTLEATRRSKMTTNPITKEERALISAQRVMPERFATDKRAAKFALADTYEARLAMLEAALSFYAVGLNEQGLFDCGDRARRALDW